MLRIAGDTNRHIHLTYFGQTIAQRHIMHLGIDLAGALVRLGFVNAGEQHQKLLAAVAESHADIAHRALHDGGDALNHQIPGLVAVAIIDGFKMIDVDHQTAQRGVGMDRQRHL